MSHTTTIGNFSVQSIDFEVPQGDTISSVQPTATLTLVPDPGYQIDASDFSYTSGPSQVTSVVFSQSGNNVVCAVTFDTNYVMPGNDVDIPICILGNATPLQYSLSGIVELIAGSHITPLSGNTAYSATGENGEIVQAFTFTVSADSGYFFSSAPQGAITTGVVADYSITSSNVYDSNGNLTSVTFTGNYTFGSNNVTGNVFTVIANVKEIPVLVREITSYSINTSNLSANFSTTRNMKIYGNPGALFSLTVVNEDGTSVLGSTLSNVVIPLSGVYSFNITFPAVTDSDYYDFVLTGDLAATFDTPSGQPSIFTINQYLDITVTFGVNSTNSQLNISPDVVYTYAPDKELDENDSNYNFQAVFTIIAGSTISVTSDPLTTDWPNLIAANNGGTNIQLSSCTGQLTDNDLTYTITLSGTTNETGIQNVLSKIDIDTFISTNFTPQAYQVNKTIQEDEIDPANLVVALLGYDADPDDTLTYEILTLPTNGALYAFTDTTFTTPLNVGVISGNKVLYKPDANYIGTDAFNYNVADGSATSGTAAASITVTPVNDAPIFTSNPAVFTGSLGDIYTYNFTYEDTDNTDQEVIISTQSTLPSGWTLTDNENGTGTLTGPVPSGVTTIVLIATDPGNLTDSQIINVSAAYDILSDMEFVVSYRSAGTIGSGTGQSPKTSSPINISGEPNGLDNFHTCARADFVLAAETTNYNGDAVRYRIGAVSLNNDTFDNQYKLNPAQEANRPTGTTSGTLVDAQYLDLTTTGRSVDISNSPIGTYDPSNTRSYYVDGPISANDRHQYLTIPQAVINAMTDPSSGTATGEFTLKLLPDSFDLLDANGTRTTNPALARQGSLDIHADAAWLQVFKRNSTDTNQEEVTDSNGRSFSVTTASNVVIDIFTGDVTVS